MGYHNSGSSMVGSSKQFSPDLKNDNCTLNGTLRLAVKLIENNPGRVVQLVESPFTPETRTRYWAINSRPKIKGEDVIIEVLPMRYDGKRNGELDAVDIAIACQARADLMMEEKPDIVVDVVLMPYDPRVSAQGLALIARPRTSHDDATFG